MQVHLYMILLCYSIGVCHQNNSLNTTLFWLKLCLDRTDNINHVIVIVIVIYLLSINPI